MLASAVLWTKGQGSAPHRPAASDIALFTSLPILWREEHDLSALLRSDAPPHWAATVLAVQGRLQPLDTLAGKGGTLPLAPDALLVMAQPRPLAPQENVALDQWVRGGGRALVFADPMLTAHSAFALGDKRRPQDVALLSPILARWGLELQFDDDQPAGPREVPLLGGVLPVDLPGRLALKSGARCTLLAAGLAARCRIGRGEVLVVADAALFEEEAGEDGTSGDDPGRAATLVRLLHAFSH